jgi:hypothetical protein
MASNGRKPRSTRAGRFIRGRRFDHNPLRRTADRAESIALAVLLLAFAVGAPLAAVAAAGRAHELAQQAELAQTATRRQVTAVVVAVPSATSQQLIGYGSPAVVVLRARWTAPDGSIVTGQMPVPAGESIDATFALWTTRGGQIVPHPVDASQVMWATRLGDAAGAVAGGLLLAVAGVVARRSLDRRRLAAWDADWQSTEPRWTTRA